ncbi:SCO1664 family protein [Millisia brevis]|uniref:SCO1664 family protein n=1 Tax=Millisia brevis TaxID=264148 RepID=UPI000A03A36B|nr:SCO1664 family protein [Millisia brevis]
MSPTTTPVSEAFASGTPDPTGGEHIPTALASGVLRPLGRLNTASNVTLLCEVDGGDGLRAVYKPVRGEAPLWDFPDGTLAGREVAAYRISEALGWGIVPPTILRDGPVGPGMVQRWIDTDDLEDPAAPDDADDPADTADTDDAGGPKLDPVDLCPAGEIPAGWIPILEAVDQHDRPIVLVHADLPELRRMAVFDVLINNADRKGGHVLRDASGRIFGIDHGVTLHSRNKLRTVLWGWAGTPIDPETVADIRRLVDRIDNGLGEELDEYLTEAEVAALWMRASELVETPVMPLPPSSRPIPWPAF